MTIMKKRTNNEEKTVLTLLDVLGSCIVDIFYNHMYDRAIAIHEKTNKGLTECYRKSTTDYINESGSSRFYSMLLNSLHHYVRMSTIYTDLSYPDCITLYSSLFVPKMYNASLTNEQRVNILSMVLRNANDRFANEIISQHISGIIDDHADPENIEILQDSILKILLNERDVSYDRFIQAQKPEVEPQALTKSNSNQLQSNKSQAIIKISAAFKKSITERAMLKKKNAALVKKNKALVSQFDELKNMFLNQIKLQKEQSQIIQALKSKIQSTPIINSSPINHKIDSMSDTEQQIDNHQTRSQENQFIEEEDDELFSVQYIDEPIATN